MLSGAKVYIDGYFRTCDLLLDEGIVSEISSSLSHEGVDTVYNIDGCIVSPGFVDVHTHLRQPGFSYKETIATGTAAAARGGFTHLCSMPNLNPVPDSLENLRVQLDIIKNDASVEVTPYGSITVGQQGGGLLADFEAMAPFVAGFSDDGRGVQSEQLMLEAMLEAKRVGKPIVAHCEDNSLLNGGCIHAGRYALAHSLPGIGSDSEYVQVKRDLKLAEKTGCRYHVCHVSTAQSVDFIRKARSAGVAVTAETAPHYLLLCEDDIRDEGRFKMNPPVRSAADREALIQGIIDGTLGMIATDHAPHSAAEKDKGLRGSLMGIVGLETAFPVLYTGLVKKGIISLENLIELMSIKPAAAFGFDCGIRKGKPAELTVIDLNEKYTVNPDEFLSMGRSTPFEGAEVCGRIKMTFSGGRRVYSE